MNKPIKQFSIILTIFSLLLTAVPMARAQVSPFPILDPLPVGRVAGVSASAICDTNILNSESGFYGQYYNLTNKNLGFNKKDKYAIKEGGDNYWYNEKYWAFDRVDMDINFGKNFLPVNEGKKGDPHWFAVHWRAVFTTAKQQTYVFDIASDDNSWTYVDGDLLINNAGYGRSQKGEITLSAGTHLVEIYFAERGVTGSTFKFKVDKNIQFRPLPPDCALADAKNASTNKNNSTNRNNRGRVLGDTTSGYTQAVALMKTAASPDIYAIFENGYRHFITSPTAFANYGYSWDDVQIVPTKTLNNYPDARLVRTPEDKTIYFIYTRPDRQWLKIAIPSPTAFASYPENYWGNVLVVDRLDRDAYPNANLVKTKNSPGVYLIDSGEKRLFYSGEIFESLGYSWAEIVTISTEHLETYKTGEIIG